MPELGSKHNCFHCGTKFYDLKKIPVLCPKCQTDQKGAPPPQTSPQALQAARRAKRDEFADPDLFERNRDDEDVPGAEPDDPSVKTLGDDEELPLGQASNLEGAETGNEDDY
jgi:hypothetical protein